MTDSIAATLLEHRYRPLARIGQGAFGQVWLVVREGDEGFRLPCAIKILHPPSNLELAALSRDLFVKEARILAGLRDDHIVRVIDFFSAGANLCLVMEYVEGLVLSALLAHRRHAHQEPLPMVTALSLIAQAARGLHHAHTSLDRQGRPLNLLHRDIKPSNLILSLHGRLQLLDFGVAAIRAEASDPSYILGTPQYMSPEQARGKPLGPASDLYALGLVLYEMLTLEPMIQIQPALEPQKQAAELEAGPLIDSLMLRQPEAAELLRWILQPAPEQRPQDGRSLAEQIEQVLHRQKRRPDLARFCALEIDSIQQSAPQLLGTSLTDLLRDLPATQIALAGEGPSTALEDRSSGASIRPASSSGPLVKQGTVTLTQPDPSEDAHSSPPAAVPAAAPAVVSAAVPAVVSAAPAAVPSVVSAVFPAVPPLTGGESRAVSSIPLLLHSRVGVAMMTVVLLLLLPLGWHILWPEDSRTEVLPTPGSGPHLLPGLPENQSAARLPDSPGADGETQPPASPETPGAPVLHVPRQTPSSASSHASQLPPSVGSARQGGSLNAHRSREAGKGAGCSSRAVVDPRMGGILKVILEVMPDRVIVECAGTQVEPGRGVNTFELEPGEYSVTAIRGDKSVLKGKAQVLAGRICTLSEGGTSCVERQ